LMTDIPPSHPRYKSLVIRERLVGMLGEVVVPQGLIAHGRGECFDYLLGEETPPEVYPAYRAAAALLRVSRRPVIAVNGNAAALAHEDIGRFAERFGIPIEINLFHYSRRRVEAIARLFRGLSIPVYTEHDVEIPTVSSRRRLVSREGIYSADTVMLMIEDGDMPEGLRRLGKRVISIDLNPLSRTARNSDVTIVDNLVRVFPILSRELESMGREEAREILLGYDNRAVLGAVLRRIRDRLSELSGHYPE